jgi:pyruvate/2-oxoglutarate/acetoin dehydrogenase E1 component
MDALSRRLSFKMPIVIRYNIGFAVVLGMIHSTMASNIKWMRRYFYMIPFGITFLCY